MDSKFKLFDTPPKKQEVEVTSSPPATNIETVTPSLENVVEISPQSEQQLKDSAESTEQMEEKVKLVKLR